MSFSLVLSTFILFVIYTFLIHYSGYKSGYKDGFNQGKHKINEYIKNINQAQGDKIIELMEQLRGRKTD